MAGALVACEVVCPRLLTSKERADPGRRVSSDFASGGTFRDESRLEMSELLVTPPEFTNFLSNMLVVVRFCVRFVVLRLAPYTVPGY